MTRKAAVAAFFVLLSLSAVADTRELATREMHPRAGTVSGIVQSVEGKIIRLAGGLVLIDATDAQIVVGRGREATVADIEPGMMLFATIATQNNPSSHPVQKASMITATRFGDATLTGTVQMVDVPTRSLFLLGQTIYVDDETSFGGYHKGDDIDLSDVMVNQLITVQVDAVNGRLVAREVLVLAPVPPQVGRVHGTVKSIGTESWEIQAENEVVTVVVNAQTKIAGSPKVGDTVEVLYNIDSANQKVAISIIKFERPSVPKVVQFRGNVKSVSGSTWVVTEDPAHERTFTVTEGTKITGSPALGDLVQVIATQADDGKLTAIAVMKLRL
jgi:hypothetical protein